MENKIIKFKVDFNFNWTYGVELSKIKEDISELEKLGVTEIEIESVDDYGSSSVSIEAFINRLETDEDCELRINKEKNRQNEIKKIELQQLELLKLKYEQQNEK